MAGGGGGEDDAVSINVTPLIDIIFCLCIFFMCSFHFKQLQGKLDSWLPKDKGNQAGGLTTANMDEIRIFIRQKGDQTELAYGARVLADYNELESVIKTQWDDYCAQGKQDKASVIIDGEPNVPWRDVLNVLDKCKKLNIEKVEFAQPMPTNIPGAGH